MMLARSSLVSGEQTYLGSGSSSVAAIALCFEGGSSVALFLRNAMSYCGAHNRVRRVWSAGCARGACWVRGKRVCGMLGVARAFGDAEWKFVYGKNQCPLGTNIRASLVSSTPDVRRVELGQ